MHKSLILLLFLNGEFFYERGSTDWEAVIVSVVGGLNRLEELNPGTQRLDFEGICTALGVLGFKQYLSTRKVLLRIYLRSLVQTGVLEARAYWLHDLHVVRHYDTHQWHQSFREVARDIIFLPDDLISLICEFTIWTTRKPKVSQIGVSSSFQLLA